jgi:hypothetical protein
MKTLITAALVLLLLSMENVTAQKIEGRLSVSGLRTDTRIKETTAADFYKAFRDGTYKINFSYKAENVGKRGLVVFDMKTTVKYNGKIISESTRSNWPWIPVPPRDAPVGVFVPIEAFDLIPALQEFTFEMPAPKLYSRETDLPLPKGKYEVSLQMIGFRPEGLEIPSANFSFVVE